MRLVEFRKSNRSDKRFVAVFEEPARIIHFGAPRQYTYIDHGNKSIRQDHMSRRKAFEEDYLRIDEQTLTTGVLWGPDFSIEGNLARVLYLFGIQDAR
jgi:hypothetical protein